jgi:microcystin-dependent protein
VGVPAGTVIAYAGPISAASPPPTGWLLCDGTAVSRTTYAALFAAVGTSAGEGDGSTTFNLPDFQGRFLRGLDNGTGRDPDVQSRSSMATGGNFGDAVCTVEGDQLRSHTHAVSDPGHRHAVMDPGHNHASTLGSFDYFVYAVANGGQTCGLNMALSPGQSICFGNSLVTSSSTGIQIESGTTGVSNQSSGGNETRPANATVHFLIKY